jgi:electron transport complex protein RnfE
MGIGFTLVLTTLGAIREFLGQGTLFHQADLLFGEGARLFELSLGEGFQGALLAILPPGAFIALGLLIALKNLLDKALARREASARVSGASPPGDGHPAGKVPDHPVPAIT